MVIFNDLRISEDRKYLIVDCQIEDVDGYDGLYIDKVDVMHYSKITDFSCIGYDADAYAINLYTKDEDDDEDTVRSVRLTLSVDDIPSKTDSFDFGTTTFENGLFYVAVTCGGTPENAGTLVRYGCGADKMMDIGVILDWYAVYQNGMAYASKLAFSCGNSCDDPSGYEQFILHWYGLQLAIATCDWIQVAKFWPKFLRMFANGVGKGTISGGCGCRG